MNIALKISGLVLLIICMSCEEMRLYDCSNCLETEPVEAFIDIRLTQYPPDQQEQFTVRIYRGKVENSILIDELIVNDSFRVRGIINQEYSAVAVYERDNREYVIINSATPRLVDRSDYCERACYMVKDTEIDLRLKYE